MDPIVVVDTEGSGLYPDDGARVSVVSWAYRGPDGQIVAEALPFGQGPYGQLFDEPEDAGPDKWEWLMDWLSTCRLVFHNAPHDLQEINAGTVLGYPGRNLIDAFEWDTSVGQRHLDPTELVGLEPSCVRRLGVPPWKVQLDGWSKRYGGSYTPIPWSVIKPYALDDPINTLLLAEDQFARLDAGEGNREVLGREMDITRVLFNMELRGLGFDAKRCEEAAKELRERIKLVVAKLPSELQPPTQQRICAYYYDKLRYAPAKKDGSGNAVQSADDFSRKSLRDQGAPYIDELDEWSELETAETSWYTPWPRAIGPDGRLRMRVRQTKVTSGRFSGERVNLLAIPHDKQLPKGVPSIRSMIRPAPGKQLWEVDLGQAEVRVGAVATQCQPLMSAYEQGFDVYELTADDLFSIKRGHPEFDHYRQLCKRLVLATLYAAGAATLSVQIKKFMTIDISVEECQKFLNVFRKTYPEFGVATRRFEKFAIRHGYVPLALGERRYFKPFEMICSQCRGSGCRRCDNTGKSVYKALNQRIQGSVAAVMKVCMIETERMFPGVLLLQTHDSLLLETDDLSIPQHVSKIMTTTFENVFRLPFVTESKRWE